MAKPDGPLVRKWRDLAEEGFLYAEISRQHPPFSVDQVRHYCLGHTGRKIGGPIQKVDRFSKSALGFVVPFLTAIERAEFRKSDQRSRVLGAVVLAASLPCGGQHLFRRIVAFLKPIETTARFRRNTSDPRHAV